MQGIEEGCQCLGAGQELCATPVQGPVERVFAYLCLRVGGERHILCVLCPMYSDPMPSFPQGWELSRWKNFPRSQFPLGEWYVGTLLVLPTIAGSRQELLFLKDWAWF